MSRETSKHTVTEEKEVLSAWVCDYCGERDEEYPKMWWFLAPGWVSLKWGGDPLYSKEAHICPKCSEEKGLR